jgi:Zn-dependent protease
MVKCDRCGREVEMPFRCNYCGGYFCSDHRLPEFHECTGLYRGRGAVNFGRANSNRSYDSFYRPHRRQPTFRNLFKFSDQELRHLAISLLIIASIPLMWLRGYIFLKPLIALGAVGIFAAAFLLHELAHKFSAQRLGYWAEFRLNTLGLLITLLSFFSPFKLVAPGAVVIAGLMYGDDYGKIALAGPVTNIAQAIIFLALRLSSSNPMVKLLAYVGVTINSSLALFNLIPFGVFDGIKVLRWDWRAWLIATIIAGSLFLYSAL